MVNTIADGSDFAPGNGVCETATGNGNCTLRAAIEEANGAANISMINFNVPGAGPHQFNTLTDLPAFTQPVTIDGYTQPGSSANTRAVGNDSVHQIEIREFLQFDGGGASSSVVRGLVFNNTGAPGLRINGANGLQVLGNFFGTDVTGAGSGGANSGILLNGSSSNVIGGSAPADRNVITNSGNGLNAISGSQNNLIIGNYFGTNAAGTSNVAGSLANGTAIALTGGTGNQIGGTAPGEGNLISGNSFGITAEGNPGESGLKIYGNLIGTDATGLLAIGNNFGVYSGSPTGTITGLVIGNGLASGRNVISSNNVNGIDLYGNVPGAVIKGNYIGVGADGVTPRGNQNIGIRLGNASAVSGTVVGSGSNVTPSEMNIIANNGAAGVEVRQGVDNDLSANSYFNNVGPAISLFGHTQDLNDPDGGPNNGQNYPIFTAATTSLTQQSFSLLTTSAIGNSQYPLRVDVYAVDSFASGEGKTFLGRTSVAAPGAANLIVATPGVVGDFVVAVVTDAAGNTSPFGGPAPLGAAPSGATVVNSTGDGPDVAPGNGQCETAAGNGICTLRAAIQETNAAAGADVINFNIPGAGVHTITPASQLPNITETVTIDGYTQPGSSANTLPVGSNANLLIELSASLPVGLRLQGTTGSVIRGLVVNGFTTDGIHVRTGSANVIEGNYIGTNPAGTAILANGLGVAIENSSGNVVGGTTPGQRNVISGNTEGVAVVLGSSANRVIGNYIGTDAAGLTALPNTGGVVLTGGANNEVGGNAAAEGNLISGNITGITTNTGESAPSIRGNLIGTDRSGNVALPNTTAGVFVVNTSNAVIGDGTAALGRNVISGNGGAAVQISSSTGAIIRGNYIGVGSDGVTAIGNASAGVLVSSSSTGTQIGGTVSQANIIANTAGPGVRMTSGTGTSVLANSIFNNTSPGIILGSGAVSPANDAGDPDVGPNNLQNSPLLQSVAITPTELTYRVSIDSINTSPGVVNYPMRVEFFIADVNGQGKTFLTSNPLVDQFLPGQFAALVFVGAGPWPVVAGDKVVATVTDAQGNTSSFSAPVTVTGAGAPGTYVVNSVTDGPDAAVGDGICQTATAGECTLRAAIETANAHAGADVINFNIPGVGVHTITPATALPVVTGALTIDALTGNPTATCAAWPPVLTVELDATNLVNGLEAISGSSLTVRGLVINRYRQTGVALFAGGIANKLECNFIGTDANGTQATNPTGSVVSSVFLASSGATIGGTLPSQRNLLSGAQRTQIEIRGNNNVIFGNYIGTDKNGNGNFGATDSVAQGVWLLLGASNNQIGGVGVGEANIISNRSTVGGVVVSDNTSVGNRIRGNSIFGNGGLGIDLGTPSGADIGVTYNHPSATVIPGPNNFQNFPVLTSAWISGTSLTVSGTLEGIPNETFAIDLYSNACDSSGFGEGARPIGSFNATTSATGQASFSQVLTVSNLFEPMGLSATATRTSAIGDTSEFSYCRPVSTTNTSWGTAQTIAGAATQFISDRNQEKWFKFPVTPGAKVTVKLTAPSGSAISLHRDPLPIYNGLNNPKSAVALSAEAADYAFLPSGTLPSGTLPSGTLPSGTLPSGTLPSGTLERGFLPSGTLPSGTLPSGTLPSGTLPSGTLPSGTLPSGTLPSGTLPSGTLPSGTLPSGTLPSGTLPSGTLPSGTLPSGTLPSGTLPSGTLVEAYGTAARQSVLGVSQDPYATQQTIERSTFDLNEDLYVRVVGPFTGLPFTVTVTVAGGVCSGIRPITTGALPTFQNSTKQTVIVTDMNRIPGDGTEKQAAIDALNRLAQRTDVNGVVVDLAANPRVSAARTQADSVKECPQAQNIVAKEIKAVIDSYRSPALKYVVLAGSADVIPYYQVQDVAGLANERDYIPPVSPNSASEAGLRSGLVAGQDFYGSSADITVGSRTVSVPGLAVGRLVDTAADITNAVVTYETNGGVVTPRSSLVTGYDFVGDAAQDVATDLAVGTTGPNAGRIQDTLIQPQGEAPTGPNAWTADQLRTKLLAGGHDVIAISGHFSAGSLLAADYSSKFSATELAQLTNELRNSIVIALGCHGGYSVPTPDLLTGSSPDPDWAKAFLRKGSAGFIAATGYAYGDTILTEYGERLVVDFTKQMRTGDGEISIGEALVKAKQNYLANTPELAGIDEKTVVAMALFGLPMMKVNMPGARLVDSNQPPVAGSPDPVLGNTVGLTVNAASIGTPTAEVTRSLPNLGAGGAPINTTYFTGLDGVVARPFEPILPKQINDVTVTGQVLRGVGFRGGTYTDHNGVYALTSSANTETSGPNQSFNSDVFYPNQTYSSNFYDAANGGSTNLISVPAQYRSTSPGSSDGTIRTFDNQQVELYYLPSAWPSGSAATCCCSEPGANDYWSGGGADRFGHQLQGQRDPGGFGRRAKSLGGLHRRFRQRLLRSLVSRGPGAPGAATGGGNRRLHR